MKNHFTARVLKAFDTPKLCFLIFYLICLFFLCSNLGLGLADPDYFWQLKTGEVILSSGTLPETDPFSYTATDKTLPVQAWLSQVILYKMHSLFGDRFMLFLVALVAASAWYYSFQSARIFLPSPVLSLACALLFTPGLVLFLTPRPNLISFLFFAFFLNRLLLAKYTNSWRPLVLLPLLMVLWVNMHGAYVIGLALLLFFVLAEGVTSSWADIATFRSKFNWFTITFVASVGASLLNPNGLDGLLFPFQLTSLYSTELISEWQAIDLKGLFGKIALTSGLLVFVLNSFRKRAPDLLELGLPICMFIAGMTTQRYYPFAALTLIPFLAQAIAEGAVLNLFEGPFRLLRKPFQWLKSLGLTLGQRLQTTPDDNSPYVVHWVAGALMFFVITPVLLNFSWSPQERDARLPIGAVNFVEANALQGNMLNSYNIGGYLLYRLYPIRLVFIDPRADLYGDPFFKRYLTIVNAEDGWREALAEWNINYGILSAAAPIRSVLVQNGDFAEVYNDGKFAVIVRRDSSS